MKSAGNAFYVLLVVVSTAFVVTALAYCLPMEHLPAWLQEHGWKLLLAQAGCIVFCGLLSMAFDKPPAPNALPPSPANARAPGASPIHDTSA